MWLFYNNHPLANIFQELTLLSTQDQAQILQFWFFRIRVRFSQSWASEAFPEMGSEIDSTIEGSTASSSLLCTNDVLNAVESTDDALINGEPVSSAVAEEANGFLSNVDNLPAENVDTLEPKAVNANVPSGDDGSGWRSASHEGNGSGWISADGAPVVLPAAPPEQPWPSSRRRTLFLIRIPRSVDEKLRNEIKNAEAKFDQSMKRRDVHKVALQAKKAYKAELLEKLKPIRKTERACRDALQGKRMELEPFSLALNKFKSAQSNLRGKGQDICSSEEELNDKIAEIQYRIQHESIPLKEEKQLLRDIKQLESTRSQVCANSVLQAELMENLGPREEIQDQYKFLCQDLDSIRKEHKQARADYDAIDKEIDKLNEVIEELRQQYEKANTVQQDAYAAVRELKKQENLKNDMFYQNKRDIQAARELVTQKKQEDLEDFCTKKLEDFMGMWNNDAKFRSEYVKSNERSTVRRLETLDGRSLGPGEKPPQISEVEVLVPQSGDVRPVVADSQVVVGHLEVSKAPSSVIQVPETVERIVIKESLHGKYLPVGMKEDKDQDLASTAGHRKSRQVGVMEDMLDSEVRTAELKEKLRQEQIAKAKEAEERKKKRAEKLELKAEARAKKDAERKEKEREKKAQKKVAASTSLSSDVDTAPPNEESVLVARKLTELTSEDVSKNAVNVINKTQKRAGVSRRKLSAKDFKPSRPTLTKPFSKKSAWPIPLWALALIAVLVLLVALVMFLRL